MQATFTLATTTFAAPVAVSDTQVNLVSTSGIVPGVFLFANRELLKVIGLTGVGNAVSVLRGQDGTATRAHGTGETIFIAQGYQLFSSDPQGLPGSNAFASVHINVLTGALWVIQGDDVGPQMGARTWQQITTAQQFADLGIRQNTTTTPT